jgi:UDPglucose--hexose-1-phosphate uridylyltransferase
MEKPSDKPNQTPSELRLDLASEDWVVIATGRAKKPEDFKKEKRERSKASPKSCPFCDINSQGIPTLILAKAKEILFKNWEELPGDWTVMVVPNKYPAFSPQAELNQKIEGGLYKKINAVGFHEVVVTRDHKKQMAQFSISQIKEVLTAYQNRFLSLKTKEFVNYISIFHNQGPQAGASISHPHSQIITTPLVDVDIKNALLSAQIYDKIHKKCLYCKMLEWEREIKTRIVFENKSFLALCPFASKSAFQVIISPKKHSPYFELLDEEAKSDLAEAFQQVLGRISKGLNDPDYNFYLHTSPCDGKGYDYYHWHWTIVPKTSTWAGFEIGTRMEISTIEPEKAAEYLRKQ